MGWSGISGWTCTASPLNSRWLKTAWSVCPPPGPDTRNVRRPGRVRGYVAATAAAAAVIVAVVGLARCHGPGPTPGPARLASFEVSTAPGGLVKLTLSPGQLRDPGALHQAPAKVGVPAVVTVGKVCYVPGPSAILTQVLSSPPQHLPDGRTVWTITPSAIPKGIELSIGYYHVAAGFGIHVTLVPDHAVLTCTAGVHPPRHTPEPGRLAVRQPSCSPPESPPLPSLTTPGPATKR